MSDRMNKPEPWADEDNWQQAAIGLAVLLVIGFGVASLWVILADSDQERLLRVQIASPIGVFGIAAVTFCTVVWRGLISRRQADAQREQLDKLADQIASTDENNLAKLLQEGAKLLAEGDKPSHVAAGIATLRAVAIAPMDRFAVEAADLLGDFVNTNSEEKLIRSAASAIQTAADAGRIGSRTIFFVQRQDGRPSWPLLTGVGRVVYTGGYIDYDRLSKLPIDKWRSYSFRKMEIIAETDVIVTIQFSDCFFRSCSIREVRYTGTNKFVGCDFSNCRIMRELIPGKLSGDGNFYRPGEPPVMDGFDGDWEGIFSCQDTRLEMEVPF